MYKSYNKFGFIAILAIMFVFASNVYSQVPANSFLMNASFSSEWNSAGIGYTLSNNIEVGAGLVFTSQSYSVESGTAPDSKTTVGFDVYAAYYLAKGDVNPYLMLQIDYTGFPKETSGTAETTSNSMAFEFAFGGNTFVTKALAVYAHIGIRYDMHSTTNKYGTIENTQGVNTLSLFNSAVGASFYF